MRRDYVTLEVRNTGEGDEQPAAVLTFDGPAEVLEERLADAEGEPLDGDRIDVAFRYQTAVDADDAAGVFSLTHRVTGDFVLEVNADADRVLDLVDTARDGETDGEGRYRVVVRRDDEEVAVYEKRTLLVYDDEGSLLRGHSLIPSGVEL